MRLGIAVFLLSSAVAYVQNPTEPLSPELEAVRSRVASGDTTTVDAFWNEVTRSGAPLIESISSDLNHVLVTFLYRGNEGTRNVAIIGGFTVAWSPEKRFASEQAMAHLSNTASTSPMFGSTSPLGTAAILSLSGFHELSRAAGPIRTLRLDRRGLIFGWYR